MAVFYLTSGINSLYEALRALFNVCAFIYLFFALRRVYTESAAMTFAKAAILFALEVSLFVALNIAGFMLAVYFA